MYDKVKAFGIGIAESNLPSDKIREWKSGLSLRYTNNDQLNILTRCLRETDMLDFVKQNSNLLLYSENAGNGKTTLACRMALRYMKQFTENVDPNTEGLPVPKVTFINVPEYFAMKKLALGDSAIADKLNDLDERIATSSLVIWDDIAYKGSSTYEDSILYLMLNKRAQNGGGNIFTSNVLAEKLDTVVSGVVANRIMCTEDNRIHLSGKSWRGYKVDNNR